MDDSHGLFIKFKLNHFRFLRKPTNCCANLILRPSTSQSELTISETRHRHLKNGRLPPRSERLRPRSGHCRRSIVENHRARRNGEEIPPVRMSGGHRRTIEDEFGMCHSPLVHQGEIKGTIIGLYLLQGYILCILIISPPLMRFNFFPRPISLRRAGRSLRRCIFKASSPFFM